MQKAVDIDAGDAVIFADGQIGDVADLTAFLASDRAGFITGTVIPVDGGILTT